MILPLMTGGVPGHATTHLIRQGDLSCHAVCSTWSVGLLGEMRVSTGRETKRPRDPRGCSGRQPVAKTTFGVRSYGVVQPLPIRSRRLRCDPSLRQSKAMSTPGKDNITQASRRLDGKECSTCLELHAFSCRIYHLRRLWSRCER
jgi:hypothetical protein